MKKVISTLILVLLTLSCAFAVEIENKRFDILLRVSNGELSSLELLDYQALNPIKTKDLQIIAEEQELCAIKVRTNRNSQNQIRYTASPLRCGEDYAQYTLSFVVGTNTAVTLNVGSNPENTYSMNTSFTPVREASSSFYSLITYVTLQLADPENMPIGDYEAVLIIERTAL